MAARITRKELKTDKFALEVTHTVDYVAEHRKQIVRYGSVAAAVVILAAGMYFYRKHAHGVRQQALADAIQIQEAPVGPPNPTALISFPTEEAKRTEAVKAFTHLASKYSGSDEAQVAQYYVGAIASDQGRTAEAEKSFRQVADSGPKDYASLAQFSLAQIYFAGGRSAEGEKLLRSLMAHPTIFVSRENATIALARAIAATRPAEARKLLEPLRTSQRSAVSQAAINAWGEVPGQ